MFNLLKIFQKKEPKKYDIHTVKLIISSIVRTTVNRDVVREILETDLKPIIGQSVINQVYEKMNKNDRKKDDIEIQKWIRAFENGEFDD